MVMKQDFGLDGSPPPRSRMSIIELICLVSILGVIAALLWPAVAASRRSVTRPGCANNLRQIALALMAYRDAHGDFPPAVVADAAGRPMHSWRTLILPYIDERALHDIYDFSQPWDAPRNRKVAEASIPLYQCPADPELGPEMTSYVLIRGPGTAFPNRPGPATTRDDPAATILVAEVLNSGIHWPEPRDLDVGRMSFRINDRARPSISSPHASVANVVMRDGTCKLLGDKLGPAVVKALITIDGGEIVAVTEDNLAP